VQKKKQKQKNMELLFSQGAKLFWSDQLGKIILSARQFVQCPALNETPY